MNNYPHFITLPPQSALLLQYSTGQQYSLISILCVASDAPHSQIFTKQFYRACALFVSMLHELAELVVDDMLLAVWGYGDIKLWNSLGKKRARVFPSFQDVGPSSLNPPLLQNLLLLLAVVLSCWLSIWTNCNIACLVIPARMHKLAVHN